MNEKVFIISGAVLIILVVAHQEESESSQCANFNQICDTTDENPCCEENSECMWSDYANEYRCKNEGKLGESCLSGKDCAKTLHSTCSSGGKCVCRQNHDIVHNITCMPLLNEFCWNELCAPENSICLDKECQCSNGFAAHSNNRCLPILQETPCENDADCSSIPYAECLSNHTCGCSEIAIQMNQTFCSLRLEEFCNSNDECGIINSECIDFKCQCKVPYIYDSTTECKHAFIGMPCDDEDYCNVRIENSVCVDERCLCNTYFLPWEKAICLPKGSIECQNDNDCTNMNFTCIDHKCQCKPADRLESGKCVPRYLGGSCKETSDCSSLPFTRCLSDMCVCLSGFTPFDQKSCVRGLNLICKSNEECLVKNSHCFQEYCQCDDGYIQELHNKCLPTSLRGFCHDYTDCKLIPNTRCSQRNKCICKKNYIELDEVTCALSLNGRCSKDDQCMVEHSLCINKKCQCDSRYYQQFENKCLYKFLGRLCLTDIDCIDVPYAICSNTSTCVCHSKYWQINLSECAPRLGGYCRQDEQCHIENSICINDACQCLRTYTNISSNKCEQTLFSIPCEINSDCGLGQRASCSPDKTCICDSDTYALNETTCVPKLGASCQPDECKTEWSHCLGSKCHCKPGFTAMSANQCISTESLYSCSSVDECVEPWHFQCLKKKCVCNAKNMATSNSTCMPMLKGYCWKDDQCVIDNSECIDFKCQCKPEFRAVADNLCLFKR